MPACGWEVIGCDDCSAWSTVSEDVRAECEAWAVDWLWQWTGQRFGACEEVVRPCRKTCAGYGVQVPWDRAFPFLVMTCGKCGDNCSCREIQQFVAPGLILEPVEVQIDGDVVPLSAFRVDNGNILVRQDGGSFPPCQDVGKPLGEQGTWGFTYLQGEDVPPGGGLVAGILACEYAKSLCGDDTCRLPRRISSIQRQGVVIGILDNFDKIQQGMTGIFEVDSWVMAQSKPRRRAMISSPDVPKPRLTTWTYSES